MTLDRQLEIVALRNDARLYDEQAESHYDFAIANILRAHAKRFREQADQLEREKEQGQ